MTTLIIARHGNTFDPADTPTRVGARTDLPLVESGIAQARAIGKYLKENNMIPDVVYTSSLQRTIETARIAIQESGVTNPVYQLDIFNEIDYGPDENKAEDEVIARIGAEALQKWDEEAIVPEGWLADPKQIIRNWQDFAEHITNSSSSRANSAAPLAKQEKPRDLLLKTDDKASSAPADFQSASGRNDEWGEYDEVILVVTSNGIARFAPHLTGDFEGFRAKHSLKLATGALGILRYEDGRWVVMDWNVKPINTAIPSVAEGS